MRSFAVLFPRNLAHWAMHGLFNALPSLIIALFFLDLVEKPAAVLAMFCAIGIYILAFATLTSLPGPLAEKDHLLARALRLGTKIRTGIACLSLPLLPIGMGAVFFVPDFWCGYAAMIACESLRGGLGMTNRNDLLDGGSFPGVFIVTMVEGFIISFLILMVSFFCVMFLQSRARRRAMKGV